MASFKIKFAHNCNCYNDNLLDLKCVALQNATPNGEKWEFGYVDQVTLDFTHRKETWACFMETSTRQPSQYPGVMVWRLVLFFSSGALTVERRYAGCACHGKRSTMRQHTEVLSWWFPTHLFETLFGYSFWIMKHLFLFEVFKKIWKCFRSWGNIDCIVMKDTVVHRY